AYSARLAPDRSAVDMDGSATPGVGVSGGTMSRPRPPRLTWPPLRPADRASSAVHSWAVPFSCAARPPLLAISRCFSGDIDAKPRRSLRSAVLTGRPPFSLLVHPHTVALRSAPAHDKGTLAIRLRWWIPHLRR